MFLEDKRRFNSSRRRLQVYNEINAIKFEELFLVYDIHLIYLNTVRRQK